MGGKVIKINLVGAILTIILIIAAIVGLIAFLNRPEEKKEEKIEKNEEVINQDKENYKELDIHDVVMINGKTKEIIMRKHESEHGYTINYDLNTFYIDDQYEQFDYLKSLVSDTIEIQIMRVDDNFKEVSTLLKSSVEQMKQMNKTYEFNETNIGGKQAVVEQMQNDGIISRTYFIQIKTGFLEVKTTCGEKFANETYPIIEKMLESIEIM